MIERKAKVTVNEWITHGNDAFLLTGARQIGKTYLIRQCLKESGYPYIEFNSTPSNEPLIIYRNVPSSTRNFILVTISLNS